ncbi:response regulator transcription factor [Candidatus Kaistella beijingensis]|uniref:response regulator n=1 Tax=Candidatus Kaistella beijingensis TaxID=2820270 RepID=UPI001CC39A42|nr:response regulator transcription factor [Candidatus Kaistella beijingensis]UBB90276.1 response regulator transcription factor [Candidatus Kaistella beijingensis]
MDKIKIIVVDDHPMVIEGMKALLNQIRYVELCATASNAYEAMEKVKENQPDLVITDINMPEISGVELTSKLKKEFPNLKIIGMSTFNERSYISQMIQNGADGFLVKSASKEEIETAISSVLDGKMHLSSDAGMSTSEQKELKNQPTLTRREKEILTLISEGFTNPQIAEKLFISLYTVETHRKNLLSKFNTNNTASLIKIAATNGLL